MTAPELTLDEAELRRLAESALAEDRADDDVTTAALVPDDQTGRGLIIARAEGILAGLPIAGAIFAAAGASLAWHAEQEDGHRLSPGDRVVTIEGLLASILRAERVALNYLTHLSGVATATAAVVRALEGTGCRLRDTRKTIPGLRALEKYAVRVGGGTNHRPSLAQGVLIKDNHLAALRDRHLGIADALRLTREANPGMTIEIEVTTVDEARQALDPPLPAGRHGAGRHGAAADELLLDNMPPRPDARGRRPRRRPRPPASAGGLRRHRPGERPRHRPDRRRLHLHGRHHPLRPRPGHEPGARGTFAMTSRPDLEIASKLIADIKAFEQEANTIYSALVLPNWGGELHGFHHTLLRLYDAVLRSHRPLLCLLARQHFAKEANDADGRFHANLLVTQ